MIYKIETIVFTKFVAEFNEGKLILDPPYQRNSIWSINNQKLLIDSIKRGWPLPTFFVRKKGVKIEMIDGQQRTRALISYMRQDGFLDSSGKKYKIGEFDNYLITVVYLSEKLSDEEIREFYVRVNRSGAKLERPELNKAEYFKTRFLSLSNKLSELIEFRDIKIFSISQIRRMFDRDFVEEICALILKGIQDKKKVVDQIYKSDIQPKEEIEIENSFKKVMGIITELNKEIEISETRFTQKNDFYTFFYLILGISNININEIKEFYQVLVFVSYGISPSTLKCKPLKEYADNCITQSNSKSARQKRYDILSEILFNKSSKPNSTQLEIISFYKLDKKLKKVGNFYTIQIL